MSFPYRSSVAMNGEEPPLRKKASLLLLPQTTISSLPDDLVLSCLARVSRLYYPTLSLVSKRFCSLLVTPELYKTRSVLGRTEACLYVCIRFHRDTRWFTLCLKPNRIVSNDTSEKKKTKDQKKKSSGYVLATIPIPYSPVHRESLVSVGSNIYAIGNGGSNYELPPSSSVSILDCKSHTWQKAPSMRVKRKFANAIVFDGKIYVAGGCREKSNWMEFFDLKNQTWETVFCPVTERCWQVRKSAVIDGKIYMLGEYGGLAYKPKKDRWEALGWSPLDGFWTWFSCCVIDNVLYSYCYKWGIRWYDFKLRCWMDLISLEELPTIYKYCRVNLVCYGEKMVVLCDKNLPSSGDGDQKNKKIWCAVIALEKCKEEIWGIVESLDDDVLTVPSSYEFVCALPVTV